MPKIKNLWHDHRGVAAMMFLVSAGVFLCVVGLATDTGAWYLERRHGQNAADAAAIAGALETLTPVSGGYVAAGKNVGKTYGYTDAQILMSQPAGVVQAIIWRDYPRVFTSVLLGNATHRVSEIAKAAVITSGSSCALALSGGMTVQGSTVLKGCDLTANSPIRFKGTGKSQVTGGIVVTSSTCTADGSSNPCGATFQPATVDPFASTASATMPPEAATTTSCENIPPLPLVPYETNAKMYCTGKIGSGGGTKFTGDLTVSTALDILPGTYVFYGASLTVAVGGTLTCTTCTGGKGVTFIFTGDSKVGYGTLTIKGTVNLNAPSVATTFDGGAFTGILFYMDKKAPATNGAGNAPVDITANGTTTLTGGMYFPSVNVSYSGNAVAGPTGLACTELVGFSVTFSGNSTLDVSQCAAAGVSPPQVRVAQLVQ